MAFFIRNCLLFLVLLEFGVAVAEFINATCGVNQFHLTCIERV